MASLGSKVWRGERLLLAEGHRALLEARFKFRNLRIGKQKIELLCNKRGVSGTEQPSSRRRWAL